MKHFDLIYDAAKDNYGIITATEALTLGVSRPELSRYAKAGWLVRIGNGVYKLAKHTPGELDAYAEAVAIVGPESWVHGESVLAMCGLALASPAKLNVATRRRLRKDLPPWIKVVKPGKGEEPLMIEGIPSQPVADAIRACRNAILPERLTQSMEDACSKGLINESEYKKLRKEMAP